MPCQILLRQCPETFFRRPKRVFLRPKGVFKRPCRTRPDEDSLCTFFRVLSSKNAFSSKNAKIVDQKQKRRKKRSLETQGTCRAVEVVFAWPSQSDTLIHLPSVSLPTGTCSCLQLCVGPEDFKRLQQPVAFELVQSEGSELVIEAGWLFVRVWRTPARRQVEQEFHGFSSSAWWQC